jgi:HAMP domain-containing protein
MRKGSKEMRIKIFTITFIVFLMILCGSSFLVYTQLRIVQDINLGLLEDKLYKENTEILSWSLKNIDTASLSDNPLPKSWAEIMLVDNNNLTVISSTNKAHAGNSMYKVPELLDQAPGIIDAIKTKKSVQIASQTYMIAIMPSEKNTSLVGFKPKSWEKAILTEQNSQLSTDTQSITTVLLIFGAIGLGLAFITALVIANIVTKPTRKMVSAFEQLSIGNFDAEIPKYGGKVSMSLAESFFRLKTSLMMALERLGGK